MKDFANIVVLIQLCVYLLMESIIIGGVLYLAWVAALFQFFGSVTLTYPNCILIIWAYKVIRFDVLNMMMIMNNNNFKKKEDNE